MGCLDGGLVFCSDFALFGRDLLCCVSVAIVLFNGVVTSFVFVWLVAVLGL